MTPPVSDMVIDFFSDARNVATVPDARAPLGEIVRKIRAGGPQKFGTQMIVESYPELMEKLAHPSKDPPNMGRSIQRERLGA